MAERPTADECLQAFRGHLYRPVLRTSESGRMAGEGRSGAERRLTSLGLRFPARAVDEEVVVEHSIHANLHNLSSVLGSLIFEVSLRRPRFPLTIERSRLRVGIDGRARPFTAYTAGSLAVVVGEVGGVRVMVQCRRSRLPRLSLEQLSRTELEQILG